jgi:hypothetical protein
MLNLLSVEPGQKLRLKDGGVAEVVENMGDGIWLQMRREAGGDEELVHCEEIAGLAEAAQG